MGRKRRRSRRPGLRARRRPWRRRSPSCGEHLGSPGVGPEDDFFALGGNSLAGIKIIERVLLDHGVRLSVRDFYLAGTPAKVAELIEQGRAGT
ncbi:phosphopantetheine-binding protein [Streptomyces erythrogriseus]